ncbi:uncharacterized protein LOC130691074 isoform X2 [Daphnia carinata]|uniref:uncharacterized protein LOC130691074 isoform X2 n=1 Tax=Daphnia carinata TaxID=120202 RepID=UPI00286870A2|nr:uncharacterized protein LOC130691074 isoform X2 [Daphnia carinata]
MPQEFSHSGTKFVLTSLLSPYDETRDMKSYSLMLLFMIACCSLASSEDTVSFTDLHDNTFWLNPFDRPPNASAFRKLESQEDGLAFYHPDDLKLLHSRWNKNQNIIPELQTSKGRPITKFVEELFPGFKFTTPRSTKKPNQPLVASKNKRSGSRKTIEGNGSKEKTQSSKPFWGPSIIIPSVRPWFYTTQATRKPPFQSNLPSIDISRELTTSDYDAHAIDGPTRKSEISIPLETREPSVPFWGIPIETSSTRPLLPYSKITTAAIPSHMEEEFLFHLSNETVNGDAFSGPIALALQQPYDLPYNPPIATERFRDPIHLKPGPPYQDKQEENDFIEQNAWQATAAVTEPTIVGNPIATEPRSPQQQLEPDLSIHQQLYPGFALNSDVGFLPKEIDTSGSYPSSYPHAIKPKPHIIYHHQPAPQHNNYYHPPSRLTHIDFSPIFLAIVPIALFLGAAAAFALASAVSSSSAVATAQQQQQQQEESSNNNNNDNNNNNNNINTILALLAAFHEVKKNHDDHQKIVIVTTTTPAADIVDVAKEAPVTTDLPLPQPSPTGPFFIKLSPSRTESPPAPLQSYGHYERKKVTYHHMNGIT